MAKMEGFRIRNFRTLKDASLGRAWRRGGSPLAPLTAVIGKNGVGKSALFDAFGFLSDSLKFGVEEACFAGGRGGFKNILSRGEEGPMEFEVTYRENDRARSVVYELSVGLDESQRPRVLKERMSEVVEALKRGEVRKRSFLLLENGEGEVWEGSRGGRHIDTEDGDPNPPAGRERPRKQKKESGKAEAVKLDDTRVPGIEVLGSFRNHPRISAFRRFARNWHLNRFTPDAARGLPPAVSHEHLNVRGDNLANVARFMEREHPERFLSIVEKVAKKIPGISRISTEETIDDRLLVRFDDKRFRRPFYAQQVSDGTLRILFFLLLLEDPKPPPLLCVEAPGANVYHRLLESLAMEFRERSADTQIFVTTHQPDFVDGLNPDEVWILEKGPDGFSTARRASDDELVRHMVAEGLFLGGLWYSDYLDAR